MSILSVRGQSFTTRVKTDSVVGTVNAEMVQFSVDDSWKGLQVFAVFANTEMPEQAPVLVLLDGTMTCAIPRQVLAKPGKILVGLLGKNGVDTVKPTMWLDYSNASEQVPPDGGVDPDDERTKDALDQMVELVQKAKETADNLQAAAEAGEFDGDPGPAGPPGKSPIIRNGTWWIWNNDTKDYTDTGVIASGGGGGGVSSYNDLSDRPTIGGVLLEGNKTAQDLGLQPKGDYATTSSKLANPYFLTFAGAVEATYDGSKAVTVTIPTIAGPAGVSPTVSTEEIDGGTRVTFTFKDGAETVDILDGNTPNLQIGTVETLEPGTDATATITGTPENPLINLGIPRGQNGKTPVKGIDYFTDEEIQVIASQAAALVPGGGGTSTGGWKLLRVYTLKEAVSKIFFDKSDDGSEFSCDIILVKARAISGGNIKSITFGVQDAIGYGAYAIDVPDCLHPTSGSANWLNVYFESAPFAVRAEAFYNQYNDGLDKSPVVQRSSSYRDNNSTIALAPFPGENGIMSSVCLCCWKSGTAGTFGAGSYFEFWGHCV